MHTSHSISIQLDNKKTKVNNFSLSQSMVDHHRFTLTCDAHQLGDERGRLSADEIYKYLGHNIVIKVENKNSKGGDLEFHGIVTQLDLAKTNHNYDQLVIVGKSNSIFADDNASVATFSEMNITDIAKKVLDPISKHLEVDISKDVEIPFVTQYRESPYNFIARLAFKYGLWFFYNGEKQYLGNDPEPNSLDVKLGPNIDQFDLSLYLRPVNFGGMHYDYAGDELFAVSAADLSAPEMDKFGQAAYDCSVGMFSAQHITQSIEQINTEADLKTNLTSRLHSRAAQMMTLYGDSSMPGMQLGTKLNVKTNTGESVGSYFIVQIDHQCDGQGHYSNSFQAIPAVLKTPPPNPNVRLPKAHAQVGYVVDNADPDGLGRVRVQFPWQDAQRDEMTPWVRVLYPYAGSGDSYFCPEIDDQVMVGFEMNNPDRPFVMGSVYHGKNKPQYFTDDNTVKAIHTKCGHRIIFEDGDESLISIYTKDDKNHIVLDVADDGKINITTEGEINLKSKTINMEGDELNIKMDGAINMEAGKDIALKGANVTVTADQAASMKGGEVAISGDSAAEIKGAQVTVDGSATTTIKGGIVQIN